jgi:isopentenyl-diphosphate delta-isomerase
MEQVVLVDDDGNGIGTSEKSTVHHRATPLHLAFSAYVFNGDGELLLTRRATTKKTWPGTWTNSCCGHPLPGERLPQAVARRLRDELGLPAQVIDLVLPRFRYRARMSNGIVENELCPVYRVRTDGAPALEPTEVAETRWVSWAAFARDALSGRLAVSPWCVQQLAELCALGGGPHGWPVASAADLPPAAVG